MRARRVILATSPFPPLLRAVRRYIAPVYDYALVSQPLDTTQRAAIGWQGRQGVSEWANQFHYYRLTADDRILWVGLDAIYRFGGPVSPRLDDHDASFARLSQHFFTTFPQLAGLRFTHRWGGAIDTCSRFCVFFGTSHDARVAYATGYTASGSPRPGSVRASRSISSTDARARRPGCASSGRSRCRSLLSRCARSGSALRSTGWRRQTGPGVGVDSGCERSTALDSDSTAKPRWKSTWHARPISTRSRRSTTT